MYIDARLHRMSGLTLIELVFFIVIVSVAVAGVLSVFNVTVKSSADPQLRKQALAVAEALLEEVQMMPFTICDPDDPKASTATVPGDCTGGAAGANDEGKLPLGSQASGASETRGALANPFDNVADYNGFTLAAGAADIGGSTVTVPDGYSATVAVTQEAFGPAPAASQVPQAAGLRIRVTVSYNNNADSIAVEGYRAQYAPNPNFPP
ncbi:MAG TPA: type II secretion system protein [Noviherbaspirillum sp.]|nr:type II secretion system protein [Noviherbaspirillum sp.]